MGSQSWYVKVLQLGLPKIKSLVRIADELHFGCFVVKTMLKLDIATQNERLYVTVPGIDLGRMEGKIVSRDINSGFL
jgi:hypothetical protein